MSIADLIAQYGYIALFIGTLLEGETWLILAGFAAHQGYLQLHWVMLIGLVGGFLGDQIYFWLGRTHGPWVLKRYPRLSSLFERTNSLMERYHEVLIVGIRFMYGLRTVGPMAMGMSAVSALRFALFNALGAAIWSVGMGGTGYLFGQALELLMHDLKKAEETLLVVILLAAFGFWAWRRYKFNKKFK